MNTLLLQWLITHVVRDIGKVVCAPNTLRVNCAGHRTTCGAAGRTSQFDVLVMLRLFHLLRL
jgi:hypothetical protein